MRFLHCLLLRPTSKQSEHRGAPDEVAIASFLAAPLAGFAGFFEPILAYLLRQIHSHLYKLAAARDLARFIVCLAFAARNSLF